MSKKDPKMIVWDEDKFYVQFYSHGIWTKFDEYRCKSNSDFERYAEGQKRCRAVPTHTQEEYKYNIKDHYNFNNFVDRVRSLDYMFVDKNKESLTLKGWQLMENGATLSTGAASIKDFELKDVSKKSYGFKKYFPNIKLRL